MKTIARVSARQGQHARPGRPFSRTDFAHGGARLLKAGRWANAKVFLYDHDGVTWAVKDFRQRSWLVRNVIGRFLIRRELRGLCRLQGLPGIPQDAFRLDAFALAYRFVPGRGLRGLPTAEIPPDFFPALEHVVQAMHARFDIVHFDMRNAANILVTTSGEPSLIDFQTHVGLRWLPGPLRRFFERVDVAAIYKHWAKRSPATLGPQRKALLDHINVLRRLWALRGYFGAPPDYRKKL